MNSLTGKDNVFYSDEDHIWCLKMYFDKKNNLRFFFSVCTESASCFKPQQFTKSCIIECQDHRAGSGRM